MGGALTKYRSILCIDDDSDDRQLFADAVREIDSTVEVVFAEGDTDILREVKKSGNGPDLVIFAINRPSEIEIDRFLRHQATVSLSRLPFCILSSTTIRSVVDHCYDLGAKAFLVKPADFQILKSLVRNLLFHDWSGDSQLKREDFVVTDKISSSLSCLMIDDDREDRDILLNALNVLYPSLPCETAFDGEDALRHLSNRRSMPDIIFLDLNMPRMNGIECLRAMRSNPSLNHSKIIVFTVSADPKDMETTKSLGANHFVTKPPDYDSLVETLNLVISH